MWADDDWGRFFDAFSNFWPGHFGRDGGPKYAQWRSAASSFRPQAAIQALKDIYEDQEFPRAPTLKLFKEAAKGLGSGQAPRDSRQGHCETCLDVRSVEIEMFLIEPGSPAMAGAPVSLAEEFRLEGKIWDAVDVRVGEKMSECMRVVLPLWCGACARSWVPESARAPAFRNRLRGKFRAERAMFEPHLRAMVSGTKLHEGPSMTCQEIAADADTWRMLEERYQGNANVLKHLGSWRKSLSKGLMPVALGGDYREPGEE